MGEVGQWLAEDEAGRFMGEIGDALRFLSFPPLFKLLRRLKGYFCSTVLPYLRFLFSTFTWLSTKLIPCIMLGWAIAIRKVS